MRILRHSGCGCGCGHDHDHDHHHDDELEILTLTLEDDTEIDCVILGTFDFEETSYIAMIPKDEKDGEDIFIFEFKECEDDEIELIVIEDEDKFNKVIEAFEELYDSED